MKQDNINSEKPVNQNDLLEEIDKTLDQLISNALAIKAVPLSLLFLEEVLMLQRTQDSLLAHLMQTQSLLHSQELMHSAPSYRHKFTIFENLSSELVSKVHEAWTGRRTKKPSC